ncbi:MAG: TetR/AcrR family transcriptional regulator [Burkholderiaceae bacterium]
MKSPEHVASVVSDPKLVEERRGGILDAAVKLFAENGYYVTTIQQIAKASGVSIGLIYQYFGDKDDILFLSLKRVLDRYETEIPARLEGVSHPVDRLCTAVWAYCSIVDELRQVAVLTYRSTGSLRADRRALIQQAELRTNRLLERCVRDCVEGGYMRELDEFLLVYQLVMFCHAWALKNWAMRERFDLGGYVSGGISLLIEPFLTTKGKAALASLRRRSGDFSGPPARGSAG